MRMRWVFAHYIGLMAVAFVLAACAGRGPTREVVPPIAAGGVTNAPPRPVLAYDPDTGTLLKADSAGLSRWDPKEGWAALLLPEATPLTGLVVVPERAGTLYISGPGLGVLRSNDGWSVWNEVNAGLPDLGVTALALHSYRPDTLFAWVEGAGIYRTEDGGKRWTQMPDPGPPDREVHALAHSTLPGSMNTGWLYASTPSGAYLSMDCF